LEFSSHSQFNSELCTSLLYRKPDRKLEQIMNSLKEMSVKVRAKIFPFLFFIGALTVFLITHLHHNHQQEGYLSTYFRLHSNVSSNLVGRTTLIY